MKSRLFLAGAATAMLLATGCAHDEKSKPSASVTKSPAPPPQVDGAGTSAPAGHPSAQAQSAEIIGPAGPGNVDLLARKTESYSKSVESLLAKRNAGQPAPQESVVDWMKKEEFARGQAAAANGKAPAAESKDSKTVITPAVDLKTNGAGNPQTPASGAPQNSEVATNARTGQSALTGANTPGAVPPQSQEIAKTQAAASGTVEAFEARLAKRVKDYPRDVSAQLEYQLWLYLRDQPVPQLATVSSLPSEDREMLTALLDALSNFRNTVRADNNTLLSKKIRPLIEMADRLRSQADLCVPRVTFCTGVKGFGQYEIMEPRFPANTETKTILYCEIENFASQLNEQQQWTSDLKLEAVLYSEDSLQVWTDKSEQVHDISRNRRHDFFIRKFVTLPKNLGVGRYLLKVSITDLQANRIAETSLPITFVAQ